MAFIDFLKIFGRKIESTDSNGNIEIEPHGSGTIELQKNTNITGNIGVTGTVDGRDVANDGSTLDSHVGSSGNPHSVTKSQVGLGNVDNTSDATKNSAAATLENKTIVSPIINSAAVLAEETSTPSAPSSGYKKLYPKNDGKMYTLNSSGDEIEVGSGTGSGSKNYISIEDSTFESSSHNWVTYNDTSDYIDGTGGSSSITLSLTTNSNEILAGTKSLKITKPASDVQFEGVSILTQAIDRADQGKVLFANISADFSNVTTLGDWEVRAYDVTNSNILYTGTIEARAISNLKGLLSVPVYTEDNTASIRLSLHCNTSDTTGYDIFIDEVKLGPAGVSIHNLVKSAQYKSIQTNVASTSGTGSAVTVSTSAPSGDATYFVSQTGDYLEFLVDCYIVATITMADATLDQVAIRHYNNSLTLIDFAVDAVPASSYGSVVYSAKVSSGDVITFGSNGAIASIDQFRVTMQMSEVVDNSLLTKNELSLQTVKARYTSNSTAAVPNTSTIFNFNTKDYDTHNAVTTGVSWKFVSPKSTFYHIQANISFNSSSSPSRHDIILFKNNSSQELANFNTSQVSEVLTSRIEDTLYLEKNEFFDIRHFETINGGSYTVKHTITITEISDFTVFGVTHNNKALGIVSSTKTPTGNNWHQLVGNSIYLSEGKFKLSGVGEFSISGGAADYQDASLRWATANGADTASAPTPVNFDFGTIAETRVMNLAGGAVSNGVTFSATTGILTVTSPTTIYLVPYTFQTTAANSRIKVSMLAERII